MTFEEMQARVEAAAFALAAVFRDGIEELRRLERMVYDQDQDPGGPTYGTALLDADLGEQTNIDAGGRDDDEVEEEWWCVTTDPFRCPRRGCDFVAEHLTLMHRIVVWPEKDHEQLLRHAGLAKRNGRNPRVVRFEKRMGDHITWFEAMATGLKACGRREAQ